MNKEISKRYYCKECSKEITEEEMKRNSGFCEDCLWEDDEDEPKKYNKIARSLKLSSALLSSISLMLGLVLCFSGELNNIIFGVSVIFIGFIVNTFGKVFGEMLQLLEDIKNK